MKIKIFIFLSWVVCSLVSFDAPASSQTMEQVRSLAGSSMRAADAIRVMVKATGDATEMILQSDFLKKIAPSEVALIVKTSRAAQKSLREQAGAFDLLAIKLRRHALEN